MRTTISELRELVREVIALQQVDANTWNVVPGVADPGIKIVRKSSYVGYKNAFADVGDGFRAASDAPFMLRPRFDKDDNAPPSASPMDILKALKHPGTPITCEDGVTRIVARDDAVERTVEQGASTIMRFIRELNPIDREVDFIVTVDSTSGLADMLAHRLSQKTGVPVVSKGMLKGKARVNMDHPKISKSAIKSIDAARKPDGSIEVKRMMPKDRQFLDLDMRASDDLNAAVAKTSPKKPRVWLVDDSIDAGATFRSAAGPLMAIADVRAWLALFQISSEKKK